MAGSKGRASKANNGLSELINSVREDSESWSVIRDWHTLPGDDRAHAIVAGALLEQALEAALLTHFDLEEGEARTLFADQEGSISTFAIKIKLSYALGIIDPTIRTELTRIKNIRNVFAHTRAAINFQTPPIVDACNLLQLPYLVQFGGLLGALPTFAKSKYAKSIELIYLYLISENVSSARTGPIQYLDSSFYCGIFLDRLSRPEEAEKLLQPSPPDHQPDDPKDAE